MLKIISIKKNQVKENNSNFQKSKNNFFKNDYKKIMKENSNNFYDSTTNQYKEKRNKFFNRIFKDPEKKIIISKEKTKEKF